MYLQDILSFHSVTPQQTLPPRKQKLSGKDRDSREPEQWDKRRSFRPHRATHFRLSDRIVACHPIAKLSSRAGKTSSTTSRRRKVERSQPEAPALKLRCSTVHCKNTEKTRGAGRTGARPGAWNAPPPSFSRHEKTAHFHFFRLPFCQTIATITHVGKNNPPTTSFGEWCNGSTTDSGSVSQGSNPCSPVRRNPRCDNKLQRGPLFR